MYNRKLLPLIVNAANFALTAPLTQGKLVKNLLLGIVSLIQTHSDSLEFNPHLHMIATDGLVDYSDISCPQFQPVRRRDSAVIRNFCLLNRSFRNYIMFRFLNTQSQYSESSYRFLSAN